MKETLTAERLRETLAYDGDSGQFTWLVDRPPIQAGTVAGCKDSRGRRIISVDGWRYYANRLAWLHVTGDWPEGPVWFRNGDITDLSWSNLEERP